MLHLAQRVPLDGVIPVIMGVQPGLLENKPHAVDLSKSWPFPPTFFIHMARDDATAQLVALDITTLKKQVSLKGLTRNGAAENEERAFQMMLVQDLTYLELAMTFYAPMLLWLCFESVISMAAQVFKSLSIKRSNAKRPILHTVFKTVHARIKFLIPEAEIFAILTHARSAIKGFLQMQIFCHSKAAIPPKFST